MPSKYKPNANLSIKINLVTVLPFSRISLLQVPMQALVSCHRCPNIMDSFRKPNMLQYCNMPPSRLPILLCSFLFGGFLSFSFLKSTLKENQHGFIRKATRIHLHQQVWLNMSWIWTTKFGQIYYSTIQSLGLCQAGYRITWLHLLWLNKWDENACYTGYTGYYYTSEKDKRTQN